MKAIKRGWRPGDVVAPAEADATVVGAMICILSKSIFSFIAAVCFLQACGDSSSRPASTAEAIRTEPQALDQKALEELREVFNASVRGPRMIVFFTSGCASCVPAASSLQQLFERTSGPLTALIVWEPVPGSGLPETPPTASGLALLHDVRVRQVWDPHHLVSREIYESEKVHRTGIPQTHLRTDKREDGILYDAVVLFAPGGRWERIMPPVAYVGGGVSEVLTDMENRLKAFHEGGRVDAGPAVGAPPKSLR